MGVWRKRVYATREIRIAFVLVYRHGNFFVYFVFFAGYHRGTIIFDFVHAFAWVAFQFLSLAASRIFGDRSSLRDFLGFPIGCSPDLAVLA